MTDYKNPGVAASVAVYAKKENSVLMIKRLKEPFKDTYAFPGGFLDVDKEDIYECAVRELEEETGVRISKDKLELIDVRSDPKRDPRHHVLDIGFYAVVDKITKLNNEADEATSWIPVEKVDSLTLAFDHHKFWIHLKLKIQS